ncbi:NAD(P)-dependent oxidoreductase [Paenibacillus sp. SI8]|uniref:NAD(P)-dependent oxidoreductase n=1 Tax=unclassified Paenibacillus TaxID=185978 RepID=UPI003466B451
MKIGVIGASGKAGSCIINEAIERGHEVTAIVRDAAKISDRGVSILERAILELTSEDLKSFDIVVNAFGAPLGQEHLHVEAGNVLIQALQKQPNTRLIVVGGAGSLYADETKQARVVESPHFPKEYLATAQNQAENLRILEQTKELQWTFISPSAHFEMGKRTGSYRTGKDQLLVNAKGESYVSYQDYAAALVDEIEHPQHVNERFTVVSESE